jgi:hypothetical protein
MIFGVELEQVANFKTRARNISPDASLPVWIALLEFLIDVVRQGSNNCYRFDETQEEQVARSKRIEEAKTELLSLLKVKVNRTEI